MYRLQIQSVCGGGAGIVREGWGSQSQKSKGHPEGQETLNSQDYPINTATIPYLFTFSALSGFRVVSTSC